MTGKKRDPLTTSEQDANVADMANTTNQSAILNGARKRHNFRVPESVWRPAIELAHAQGLSMSDVVEARLLHYMREGGSSSEARVTPQRTAMVSEHVWGQARTAAEAEGEQLSQVIRRELEAWVTEQEG